MSIQSLDSDPELVPAKPTKHLKRSKSSKGCGCTTGCKRVCGCRRQGMQCNEDCNCKMECQNIFNTLKRGESSVGSKRERSASDETVSTDDVENKENIADEVVPCTPKRQWYVICYHLPNERRCQFVIQMFSVYFSPDSDVPYVYSVKKRNPVFGSTNDDN